MKGRDALGEPGRSKHWRSERSERRSAQRVLGAERVEGFRYRDRLIGLVVEQIVKTFS